MIQNAQEEKKTETKILDMREGFKFNLESRVPKCCLEGDPKCPHVKHKVMSRRNIGL